MTKIAQYSIEQVISLIGILLGTGLALIFVPSDPNPAGALQFSAAAMACGLLAGTIACVPRGYAAVLRGENILNASIIYWLLLDLLQGAYDLDFSQAVARQTFVAMGALSLGIWFGSSQRAWNLPMIIRREIASTWSTGQLFQAGVICFALAMVTYTVPSEFDFVAMFSAIGGDRWAIPWGRGQLGGADAIWDHFQYFGYVLPVILVAHGSLKGWLNFRTILLLAMTLVILAFLATGGGRRLIGVTIGAALIYKMLGTPGAGLRNIAAGLATMIGTVAGLLYTLQWIVTQRRVGWFEEAPDTAYFQYLHVDDNFLRLGQLIEIVPDEHSFAYFDLIFFILIRPIPRLLWPGKPIDPGFDLPTVIGYNPGTSLSYSAIGDWYLIWGFPTVLAGGWFIGKLAAMLNEMTVSRTTDTQPIVVSIGLMVLFASMRSLQDLILMSYAILGWLVVSHFVQRRVRRG